MCHQHTGAGVTGVMAGHAGIEEISESGPKLFITMRLSLGLHCVIFPYRSFWNKLATDRLTGLFACVTGTQRWIWQCVCACMCGSLSVSKMRAL